MAEANGADDASIRRLGQWSSGTMEKCYFTTLPKQAMRAVAGWNPDGMGYFLPRATLKPLRSFRCQIFPEVDTWQQRIREGEIPADIAAGGFLEL